LIIYNTKNKKGFLAHIDSFTKLTILHNIYKLINIDDIDDLKIYIISGEGYRQTYDEIINKLKIIGLYNETSIVKNIGNNNYGVSLDTKTGIIRYINKIVDKGYIVMPEIPFKEKELKMSYISDDLVPMFADMYNKSWHNIDDYKNTKKTGQIEIIPVYSEESKNNTFDNYSPKYDHEEELLYYSKRFANKVSGQTERDGPFFFAIHGTAGIGKTHMSVSISKYVSEHGKSVIFINSDEIGKILQSEGGNMGVLYSYFENWMRGKDLIIIDDINEIYGSSVIFFKQVFKYICSNGKAMMVSGNINIGDLFTKTYPLYFNVNCVKILSYNDMKSNRIPWISSITDLENPYKQLAKCKNKACGIIVFDVNDRSLLQNTHRTEYKKYDKKSKIRITREPYNKKGSRIDDLYVSDAMNFDVIITKVFTIPEVEQLLQTIGTIHDKNLKMILITSTLKDLKGLISEILNTRLYIDLKPKLTDRLNIIFPSLNL
jgi:DNA replication protein DnaC